jgi:hypothetical protein
MTMQVPQSTTKSELRGTRKGKVAFYRLVRLRSLTLSCEKSALKEAEDSQKVYPGEVTYLLDKFK